MVELRKNELLDKGSTSVALTPSVFLSSCFRLVAIQCKRAKSFPFLRCAHVPVCVSQNKPWHLQTAISRFCNLLITAQQMGSLRIWKCCLKKHANAHNMHAWMYLWMYVCMCVCIYVCIYICIYIYIYTDIERERAKTYHPIYVPVFAILYVYICIFTRLHVSINSTVWQEPTQNHVSIARRSCNLLFDRLATLAHGLWDEEFRWLYEEVAWCVFSCARASMNLYIYIPNHKQFPIGVFC